MRLNTAVLVIASTLLLSSCADDDSDGNVTIIRPAKLLTVGGDQSSQMMRFPAVLEAGQTANLSFPMSGIVQAISVNEADEVVEGAELAKLDTRDIENNLTTAKAQFDNAEEEYQRGKRLFDQDAIAKADYEQRKTQRDVAKAQLDTAEKALADATINAPFTGMIAAVEVDEQQNVQGGSTVVTLIGMKEMTATVNIPARVVTRAERRDDLPAHVTFDALPDVRLPVTFKEADLIADSASQTYSVTFRFDRPENNFLLPGMTATVETVIPENGEDEVESIQVPVSAISSDANGQYVWVVDDSMKVSRQTIDVADGIGERLTVNEGLQLGDTIVVAGGAYLADGMQVRAWEDQTDDLQ